MKKMFKLLMCAAIIAAGFTACSEEVTPIDDPTNPDNTGGVVSQGEETTATFAFKFNGTAPATRGLDNAPATEAPGVDNFRVLLFNAASGDMELDTIKKMVGNDTLMTAKVMSGPKLVFVIANDSLSNANQSLMGLPTRGNISNASLFTSTTPSSLHTFTVGSNGPADMAGLRTLYGTRLVYASTTKPTEYYITLAPGITESQSKDPTHATNYIGVTLDRAMAKVAITTTATTTIPMQAGITPTPPTTIITKDTAGSINPSSIQYRIWGANAKTYPFQKWESNVLKTPEYIPNQAKDPNVAINYVSDLGKGVGATNDMIAIANRGSGPAATDYYYIPENNPSSKKIGNITIAAVEAVFIPLQRFHIVNVKYNEALREFTPVNATANMDIPTGVGLKTGDFYLLNLDGVPGLRQNTVAGGDSAKWIAKKIVYHLANSATAELSKLSDYDTYVTDPEVGNVADLSTTVATDPFTYYRGGKCYYRMKIGDQASAGAEIVARIMRNHYYDADITAFGRLGENSPNKLVEPNDEDDQAETFLSVDIIIRDWTHKPISGEV
jgi:hypothetical protein